MTDRVADKRYTPAEATALLPYLAPTLVELRAKFRTAMQVRRQVAEVSAGNGHADKSEDDDRVVGRVDELLQRLREWNVILRDVDSGLVDFPGVVKGQDAYLCWRLGEPDVSHWHSPEDGFAGRRPLPPD